MTGLVDYFKIISDETRLRVMALLFSQELCVCKLCEIMEETQPKVSKHLAKLRDLGYVQDRRQGQWIFYYLSIKDEIASEILSVIVNNKDKYPVLKRDFDRLQKMISDDCLCKMNG